MTQNCVRCSKPVLASQGDPFVDNSDRRWHPYCAFVALAECPAHPGHQANSDLLPCVRCIDKVERTESIVIDKIGRLWHIACAHLALTERPRSPESGIDPVPDIAPPTDWSTGLSVDLGPVTLRHVHVVDGESALMGDIEILGVTQRFLAIEMHPDRNNGLVPVHDPHGRYDAFVELEPEGEFETVKIAGFPGNYLICIHSPAR